ncbi:hypothetical protein Taro_026498 [Colocasia esculenta]|uniref:Uncharacterized protein n=1 Tax=Colocasia esculenta TaxID=4460 RepID=A0A843VJQ0_COLES|nr:hypothetical protein [Colocasia esculenta]
MICFHNDSIKGRPGGIQGAVSSSSGCEEKTSCGWVLARCQGLSPEKSPEHSEEVYRARHYAEEDDEGDIDVEVLTDGVLKLMAMLKQLAVHARNHK